MRLWVRSLALLSGLRIRCCHEPWYRSQTWGSDPVLLWLWLKPAAVALIRRLAWEPPYASGTALEKTKRQKKKSLFFFFLFRATPTVYGRSWARGWIGAVAAGLRHSHSSGDASHICHLHYSSQQCGSLTHWARPGIKPTTSWFLVRFINYWATTGTPN